MLTQDPDQVIAPSAMNEEQLVRTIENRMRAAHLALQPYFLHTFACAAALAQACSRSPKRSCRSIAAR
jgi:hypothetical protein